MDRVGSQARGGTAAITAATLVFLAVGFNGSSAAVAVGPITEYTIPTTINGLPTSIAPGPDGNIWFIDVLAGNIAKITTSGVVTAYPISTANTLGDITAGPDGNLWFTEFSGG